MNVRPVPPPAAPVLPLPPAETIAKAGGQPQPQGAFRFQPILESLLTAQGSVGVAAGSLPSATGIALTQSHTLLVIPYPYLTVRTLPIVPTSSLACNGERRSAPERRTKRRDDTNS